MNTVPLLTVDCSGLADELPKIAKKKFNLRHLVIFCAKFYLKYKRQNKNIVRRKP
jgi:hypothetical protein